MRRLVIASGVVVVAAVALLAVRGSARLVAWELIVVAAAGLAGWGLWPRAASVGGLFGRRHEPGRRRMQPLLEIDVEVTGAIDRQLAAAQPLKRRLRRLIHDSDGARAAAVRVVAGEATWLALHDDSDTMRLVDIERIADGLEKT